MIKTVDLGGESHPVRYSFRAIKKMQELLKGDDPFKVFADEDIASKLDKIAVLVYGGIYGGYDSDNKDCPIKFEDMDRLLDFENLHVYLGLLSGDIGEESEDKEPKKKRGIRGWFKFR